MDPSPKGAVPSQQHSQGGAHQYLLSPEALGSLQVNTVGAVTPLVHSQGWGHVCHQHRRVLGWESSSGLGSQFHPEPLTVPQWVLGVLGVQGKYILPPQLEKQPGYHPWNGLQVPNDFSWGSLGVQSHSPEPVPGAVSQPGLLSGWTGYQGEFLHGKACQAQHRLPEQ